MYIWIRPYSYYQLKAWTSNSIFYHILIPKVTLNLWMMDIPILWESVNICGYRYCVGPPTSSGGHSFWVTCIITTPNNLFSCQYLSKRHSNWLKVSVRLIVDQCCNGCHWQCPVRGQWIGGRDESSHAIITEHIGWLLKESGRFTGSLLC